MKLQRLLAAAPLLLLEVLFSPGGAASAVIDAASHTVQQGVDLTPDARLIVEHAELLAWYLQNSWLANCHLAMCLLDGPFKKISVELFSKCNGDYESIVSSLKEFIFHLPRSRVPLLLGELNPTQALSDAMRTAWKMAEQEGGPIGVHHLYLTLFDVGVIRKITRRNGCDFNSLKHEVVEQFKGRQRGKVPTSFYDMVGEKQIIPDSSIFQYGVDLTLLAQQGMLPPVIGRDEEIDRIAQILSRKLTKAPILLGEPGVGKTAVVEGLAQRIVEGAVPDALRNRRIFSLDLLSLSAGSSMRGEYEKRMKEIVAYLQQNVDEVILFVDEIHTLMGAGKAGAGMDASQMLKVPLSRGEIVCNLQVSSGGARLAGTACLLVIYPNAFRLIGATTLTEYKLHMEKDAAFCRRFQKVVVEAPSKDRTLGILRKLKANYEKHHNMTIDDEVIPTIVNLSDRYLKNRAFPDKALDLLDESCSMRRVAYNNRVAEVTKMVEEAHQGKRIIPEEELKKLEAEYEAMKPQDDKTDPDHIVLTIDDVSMALSRWTGIPVGRVAGDEMARVMKLAEALSKRVVGQDEAVLAVANAIRNHRAGLTEEKKPIAAFLFLGSSGVGKTELAKALANEIFHSERNMIRLDMAEYQEAQSISRLIGSPPGYVGSDEGGQLTEAVRQKPHSVILFDEVENAHKNIWSILLPMLDEGQLTDSKNLKVDFTNTIIIMTSNIGQQFILEGYKEARAMAKGAATPLAHFNKDTNSLEKFAIAKAGATAAGNFSSNKDQKKGGTAEAVKKKKDQQWNTGNTPAEVLSNMRQKVMKELLGYFKPQVVGRMTRIIIFEPLTDIAMRGVLQLMLSHLINELKRRGITLIVTDSAKGFILERAWSHKFGGRRMAKYIEKYIAAQIAPLLLSLKLKKGDKAQLARSSSSPNQLNLIVCEENENGDCKPGTKYGRVLVVQAAKQALTEGMEEDPMI